MIRHLPVFKGYTEDIRLKQFRKVDKEKENIEFIDFSSAEGDALLGEFIETINNWNWTSPTTAYNPNPASGGGIHLFVSYPEGGEWQSPYYQQTGYNPGYPFAGYNFPYSGLSSYSYNGFGVYGQPFLNNWFTPWQQTYQNYSGWFTPWQSWTPVDDCSGDGILVRKPAIYLYPEEDTEVKITLDINGIFTKTIPPYNSGWEVFATRG